ncbi:MAG: hypothetical protein H6811_02220 [Phycisphaeraceae bacterium]|nr:hypothetical protein [Phycisphaeraceae bacterium]
MAGWWTDPKTIDYDTLPPLIPSPEPGDTRTREERREAILDEIAEKWTKSAESKRGSPRTTRPPGFVLENAVLEDDQGDPINLVDLLRRVGNRLRTLHPDAQRVAHVSIVLHACLIRECECPPEDPPLDLPCDLVIAACGFSTSVNLQGARFGGDLRLDATTIFFDVDMSRAAILSGLYINSVAIGGTLMGADIAVSRVVELIGVAVDGVMCSQATFGSEVMIVGLLVRNSCWLAGGAVNGVLSIYRSSIGSDLVLHGATLRHNLHLSGVAVGGEVALGGCRLGGSFEYTDVLSSQPPILIHARFDEHEIEAGPLLATGRFTATGHDSARFGKIPPARGWRRLWWRVWTIGDARLNWSGVRAFGELAILTRASAASLIVVPILAALWHALRNATRRYTGTTEPWQLQAVEMPWVWAALFFAALLALIGRAIYQAWAPQLVRERSRFDHVNEKMEEFRRTKDTERERWLQEAIDAIAEAGTDHRLRWVRHRSLVEHHGRTVWIPSRVDDFEYAQRDLEDPKNHPKLKELKKRLAEAFGETDEDEAEGDRASGDGPGSAEVTGGVPGDAAEREDRAGAGAPDMRAAGAKDGPPPGFKRTPPPSMARPAREDIAVQAGAAARYDLTARENLGAVRAALYCYSAAMLLIVLVLLEQSLRVLIEIRLIPESSMALGYGAASAGSLGSALAIVCFVLWDAWPRAWLGALVERWAWLGKWRDWWRRLWQRTGPNEVEDLIERRLRAKGIGRKERR